MTGTALARCDPKVGLKTAEQLPDLRDIAALPQAGTLRIGRPSSIGRGMDPGALPAAMSGERTSFSLLCASAS